jgi:hypothetical protein
MPNRFACKTLPLACALALSAPAWADTSPFSVGLATQRVHDTNVLRSVDASAQSDDITSLGLRLGLDQPVGRNRLHANASYDHNAFGKLKALDNDAYQLDAGLDWTAANNWSGEFGVDGGERLFRYDLQNGTSAVTPSLQRTQHAFARARVGTVTRWTFDGGVEVLDQSYSVAAAQNRDQNWQAVSLGARLQQTPDLSVRASLRAVHGKYPHLGTGDSFDRNEAQLLASWRLSGASTLDSTVSVAQESHSLQATRDATYWLGSLRWQWEATSKTRMGLRLARDSDTGTTDFAGSLTDVRVRDALEFTVSYLPTAKIQVNAQARYAQRALDNSFVLTQGTALAHAKDTTNALSLSATYQPIRAVDLGCHVSHEQRTVSGATAGLTYPYTANVFGCFGQLWWR